MKTSLILLTLNPGQRFNNFLKALLQQTLLPEQLILIDSSSTDDTVSLAQSDGFTIKRISRNEFDHGGSRQLGVGLSKDADLIIFLTQDAIFATADAIERLCRCFENDKVGAAFGRQLPNKNASLIASHARLYNYPADSSVKSLSDIDKSGIKAAFISNSFAAYRRSALMSVGGFPLSTIFGEDTQVAVKLMQNNWKIAYCAEAMVYHSHNYRFMEDFRRYFDIGVFHQKENWFLESLGKAEGEGKRFVVSEIKYLAKRNLLLVPSAIWRTCLKYVGYKMGFYGKHLPTWFNKFCSMNKGYWNKSRTNI